MSAGHGRVCLLAIIGRALMGTRNLLNFRI